MLKPIIGVVEAIAVAVAATRAVWGVGVVCGSNHSWLCAPVSCASKSNANYLDKGGGSKHSCTTSSTT